MKKTLKTYPCYQVKLKEGYYWGYLEINDKEPIIEENYNIYAKLENNNEYLFKVTYFNNRINLDIMHILTDGLGAISFLKSIICNYLDLKYKIKTNYNNFVKKNTFEDWYDKKSDKCSKYQEKTNKAFIINDKINIKKNKTYCYILDLSKFKLICKNKKTSITEYLCALHIYTIYQTLYDKLSKKHIAITVPIDLRRHYMVESLSNFFTCMSIDVDVSNKKDMLFEEILSQVKNEFHEKGTFNMIKTYLTRDVTLGNNLVIQFVPLFLKKAFMKYFGKVINKTTSTLSNVGPIKLEEKYRKYVDNIIVLVSTGRVQKVKCTVCSYENNLTITVNSNLITNKYEHKFCELLKKHVGEFRIEKVNID